VFFESQICNGIVEIRATAEVAISQLELGVNKWLDLIKMGEV